MNYSELQARSEEIASFEGWTSVSPLPDWPSLVNRGYIDYAFDTECVFGEATLTMVVDQGEYDLFAALGRHFKDVTDVWYDSMTGGVQTVLCKTSLRAERQQYYKWRFAASGTPNRYAEVTQDTLRLFPAPATADVEVLVRGIVEPEPLEAASDEPVIPGYYHEAIALRAVWIHAKTYARATPQLASILTEYEDYVSKYRHDLQPKRTAGAARLRQQPYSRRVRI